MRAIVILAAGLALPLVACSEEQEVAVAQAEAVAGPDAETTSAEEPAADEGLRDWIIGTWSFLDNCDNDFVVVYEADGSMHTDSEIGTWTLDGTGLTETITETFEMGEEGTTAVDPPQVRDFAIEKVDDTHGVITFEGEDFPILKCSAA